MLERRLLSASFICARLRACDRNTGRDTVLEGEVGVLELPCPIEGCKQPNMLTY